MTSSKNPVKEFIEILRRIRTGHENLKVSSGIPGFIPGTGERVDAFSTALPWESATPDGLFTLKGDKPENPEGLGFAIEIFPQTGVTSEMEKTLIGLAAPLEAGSVLSITAFASSAVRGIAELMVPEARVPDGFPPLSLEAEGIIDTATNWAAENLVKGAVEQLTPQAPVYPRHWRVWLTVVVPTTRRSVKRSSPRAGPFPPCSSRRGSSWACGMRTCSSARLPRSSTRSSSARATSCVRPLTRSSLRPFR